jgi:hypothetical protein
MHFAPFGEQPFLDKATYLWTHIGGSVGSRAPGEFGCDLDWMRRQSHYPDFLAARLRTVARVLALATAS